jgi:hypothetical protein
MVTGQFYAFDLTDLTLSDANLTLYDADGNYLAEKYYYDGSTSGPLQYAGVGTFYVGVSGWETGSYTLAATAEPYSDVPGGPETDAEISAGETINDAIEVAGDQDWFRIEMVEGESYRFILRGESGGFGTLADPFLELYDAEGNMIASDDDGGQGTNARLDHTVMETGTYFVAAEGYIDSVGTYELVARTFEPVEPLIG